MGWKCDICDSYNEESERECFVCGNTRSLISILEGKKRIRKERFERLSKSICDTGYAITKVVFVLGLLSAILVIGITLIRRLSNGEIGVVVANLASVVKHACLKRVSNDIANIIAVCEHFARAPLQEISMNIEALLLKTYSAITATSFVGECMLGNAKNNIELCYNNCLLVRSMLFGEESTLASAKKQIEFCYNDRMPVIVTMFGNKISRLFQTMKLLVAMAKDSIMGAINAIK